LSVPATEHSVMCMGTQNNEIDTFRRLIEETYPKGIVSIVSDTWDFWKVITEFLPILKEKILARDGKVVIRPDSGDPVKIICGDPDAPVNTPAYKGAVECLWEIFGGTYTAKNYKLLVGIGSYTYQYVTRDTFGFAMKATYGEVNGEGRAIFKNPKTDDGTKISAKGLIRLDGTKTAVLSMQDEVSKEVEKSGLLEVVYTDGQLVKETSLGEIRRLLTKQLEADKVKECATSFQKINFKNIKIKIK